MYPFLEMPHSHESSAVIFEKSQNTQIPSLFATGTTCKKQQEKKIKKPTQNSHTVFLFSFWLYLLLLLISVSNEHFTVSQNPSALKLRASQSCKIVWGVHLAAYGMKNHNF